jgi:hypothetical protein
MKRTEATDVLSQRFDIGADCAYSVGGMGFICYPNGIEQQEEINTAVTMNVR